MGSTKNSKQKPIVSSGLFTHYPKFRDLLPEILRVLAEHGEAYTPDRVSLGEAHGFRNLPFHRDQIDDFSRKWKDERPGRAIWSFGRESPAGLVVLIWDNLSNYETVHVFIQREYLAEGSRIDGFLSLLKQLYDILHPMYGNVSTHEMLEKANLEYSQRPSGMNLKRGIPDVFWANFLGPEYVDMFGPHKVFSTPCYRSELLADGGALLLLSASPLDYQLDPEGFDRRQSEVKKHLGPDAFGAAEIGHDVRIPRFRFEEEWNKEQRR